jgi:hypothetical protein
MTGVHQCCPQFSSSHDISSRCSATLMLFVENAWLSTDGKAGRKKDC